MELRGFGRNVLVLAPGEAALGGIGNGWRRAATPRIIPRFNGGEGDYWLYCFVLQDWSIYLP